MLAGMGKKFYKERLLTEKRKLDDFKTRRLGDRPGPQVARTAAAVAPSANNAPVAAAVLAGTETEGAAGSLNGNNNRKR